MSILSGGILINKLSLSSLAGPILGQIRCHGQGGEAELVVDVDGGPALHGHVEHLDVVEDHQDVGDGAPVDVLHIRVAALGQDEPVALLLVEDCSEAVGILAPGHVAVVVRLVPQHDLLHLHRVRPEGLLVVACEEVAVASPVMRARSG